MTSPDNLVCHGEVFIRNYLVGRCWLRSVGLAAHVAPVAWLPDDFGHDPQLPVVLDAMGLRWLGLSRVPGSPQPFANQPLEEQIPSVAVQLGNEGLVFPWIASDGSEVLAHFMPATYGAPWNGSDADGLEKLVESPLTGWPAVNGQRILFAPAGGDFALSQWKGGTPGDWLAFAEAYNREKSHTDPAARIGTFTEFMALVARSAGPARSPLLAQNYWTGIFASRPRLKTLHYQAAQLAMAAEAATTLLRLTSTYSTTTLDDLDAGIDRAWQALVPSSHHDYITGTSPDRVYWSEQLPLLEQAVTLAGQCLTRAVGLIAAAVTFGSTPGGGTPVIVFNALGFARGGVVELPARAVPGSIAAVSAGSPAGGQVQRTADGGLLFQVPSQTPVDGFGYTTVTLQPGTEPAPAPPPEPSDVVTLHNDLVTVTLDRAQGWAITSFAVEGTQLLAPSVLGNSIRLYNDTGNLYQFGNEPLWWDDTLQRGTPGTFHDSGTSLAGDAGEWIEAGPVRWHFRATVTGNYGDQTVSYTLDYLLYAGETVLRMRLTGAAPPFTSVLTAFELAPPADPAGYGLTYGTAHHYDDHQPTPYWTGPTFRATHDFVQTTGSSGPELAIYHQGVPAWSVEGGQLLGALLRNTYGTDRGAAGTDPSVHTQEYALGPADRSPVATGDALRTALAATNPLVAAVAGPDRPTVWVSLPPRAALAAITSAGGTGSPAGILRAARTQPGSAGVSVDGYCAERMSFILRVYLPDPASVQDGVTITLPNLPNPGTPADYQLDLAAVVVSALEEPVDPAPAVLVSPGAVSGDTVSYTVKLTPERALTTVRLTATRRPTQGESGK